MWQVYKYASSLCLSTILSFRACKIIQLVPGDGGFFTILPTYPGGIIGSFIQSKVCLLFVNEQKL